MNDRYSFEITLVFTGMYIRDREIKNLADSRYHNGSKLVYRIFTSSMPRAGFYENTVNLDLQRLELHAFRCLTNIQILVLHQII